MYNSESISQVEMPRKIYETVDQMKNANAAQIAIWNYSPISRDIFWFVVVVAIVEFFYFKWEIDADLSSHHFLPPSPP